MTGTGSPASVHAAFVSSNAPGSIRSPWTSTFPNAATRASNSPVVAPGSGGSALTSAANLLVAIPSRCSMTAISLSPSGRYAQSMMQVQPLVSSAPSAGSPG